MWPFKQIKQNPKVNIETYYPLVDMVPEDYNGIILEIGKRYNLRCGDVVKIISEAHNPYTFLDENGHCYWWNGRTYEGSGKSGRDVVGEAIDWVMMR